MILTVCIVLGCYLSAKPDKYPECLKRQDERLKRYLRGEIPWKDV